MRRTFAALRHVNFRLFYTGQLISLVGSWMQNTAQGWLVVLLASPGLTLAQAAASKGEERANLYLSVIATASSLPLLFGALYGGALADRMSKRVILLVTQFLFLLLAFGMSALVASGRIEVWHVVAAALVLGTINIFEVPARQAFTVELVGKEDLANAIALNSSLFNAARAFGPALAGLLLGALAGQNEFRALAQCFLVNGVSYVAVLGGLFLMRGDFQPVHTGPRPPLKEQMQEVFTYIKGHRGTRVLIWLVALTSIFVTPYWVFLPSLAKFTLNVDARGFSGLMSAQGVGALCGALTMATLGDYPHKGRILTAASLSFPLLMLALSSCRVLWVSLFLVAAIGFSLISFLATANTLLQTSVPDNLRGRVMSIYALILMGLSPIGSLWSGVVAHFGGAPLAVAVGASVSLLAALTVVVRLPAFRRMGRVLPETF